MVTIWKFEIEIEAGTRSIDLPIGYKVIKVANQIAGILAFWVLIETNTLSELRRFWVLPTGVEVPENYTYLGTCLDRSFVWHLFEEI